MHDEELLAELTRERYTSPWWTARSDPRPDNTAQADQLAGRRRLSEVVREADAAARAS